MTNQQVTPNFKPDRKIIERMARAMLETNAYGGAFREALIERGFTALDLDMYGAQARQRANEIFIRKDHVENPYDQAIAAAQDDLAREEVEGTRRTLLVKVPTADLCQLWQGLRIGAGCSPVEATLRVTAAFAEAGAQ